MTDLRRQAQSLTVDAIHAHGWECVRLAPRAKKPAGPRWEISKDPQQVAAWFAAGFNVGLVCSERTAVAVLDPDTMLPWAELIDVFGQPSLPWVITGSGKLHYYVVWVPDLPAKIVWHGQIVGEIQRGPGLQQVVLPGSVHPTGGVYEWITDALGCLVEPIDPVGPLPRLSGEWLAWLTAHVYSQQQP
jgi:hypothetical protein